MKKDLYVYPAILDYMYVETSSPDNDCAYISCYFPDFPAISITGRDEKEVYLLARKTLGNYLILAEDRFHDGEKIELPKPTELSELAIKERERTILVQIDMALIREAINTRVVKKTLTIPYWVNKIAEREGINFSNILRTALINSFKELGTFDIENEILTERLSLTKSNGC